MNQKAIQGNAAHLLLLLLLINLMTISGPTFASSAIAFKQKSAQIPPAFSTSPSPFPAGKMDSTALEGLIDLIMADEMKTNHVRGAVVAVVRDGKLTFAKGYGCADYENSTPVDPERTLFRVGSVSKLFVWTAVMQLVEQGKLDLDADVNTYLDFKIPATYPQPITLKDLISHTAGFEGSDQGLLQRPKERHSLEEYVKRYIPLRVFPSGKIEAYSNYGAALAGYIIERIAGLSFNDYIETNLLTPLGMTRSTFRQPLPGNLASDLANGYYFAQGQYEKAGFEYIVPYPVGSLSSTGTDMAKFMLAHLQNGRLDDRRILSEQTAQQMHGQLFTHDPRIKGMAYGFNENRINGQRILSHGGATLIFYSKLYLIPDQRFGIFIATNAPGGASTREVLFQKFMDAYYPVETDSEQAPEPGFSIRAAPFLGTFYQSNSNSSTPEKLLRLLSQLNVSLDTNGYLVAKAGGRTFQFVEIEPGLLRDRNNADLKLVMHTDENGQAYLLTPEPSPWVRRPWYGTALFHAVLIGFGLLLFMLTMIGWTIATLTGRHRHQPFPFLSRLACWTGALFAVLLVVILAGWISLLTTPDPAYGQPVIMFGFPPMFYALKGLAYLLAGLGLIMPGFATLIWRCRLCSLAGRLHYSLPALTALSLLWALWYWNLL